jgi:hypothetical protein
MIRRRVLSARALKRKLSCSSVIILFIPKKFRHINLHHTRPFYIQRRSHGLSLRSEGLPNPPREFSQNALKTTPSLQNQTHTKKEVSLRPQIRDGQETGNSCGSQNCSTGPACEMRDSTNWIGRSSMIEGAQERERQLYVAAPRAGGLWMSGVTPVSEFLSELADQEAS